MCRDMAFLIDDKATCEATFPWGDNTQIASKTNCRKCRYLRATYPNEVCQSRDKICRTGNCPAYFYF